MNKSNLSAHYDAFYICNHPYNHHPYQDIKYFQPSNRLPPDNLSFIGFRISRFHSCMVDGEEIGFTLPNLLSLCLHFETPWPLVVTTASGWEGVSFYDPGNLEDYIAM